MWTAFFLFAALSSYPMKTESKGIKPSSATSQGLLSVLMVLISMAFLFMAVHVNYPFPLLSPTAN